MFSIHSISPAPWGYDYRLVETFDNKEQAEIVLKALESVNISFNCYKIIDWTEPKNTEKLGFNMKTKLKDVTKKKETALGNFIDGFLYIPKAAYISFMMNTTCLSDIIFDFNWLMNFIGELLFLFIVISSFIFTIYNLIV